MPLGATRWTKDPFKGEIEGGRIYGRGASDMKGGVSAMVIAGLGVAEFSKRKCGMTIVITAGEENEDTLQCFQNIKTTS